MELSTPTASENTNWEQILSGKSLRKESSKLNILQEEIPFLMLDDLSYILAMLLVQKTLKTKTDLLRSSPSFGF